MATALRPRFAAPDEPARPAPSAPALGPASARRVFLEAVAVAIVVCLGLLALRLPRELVLPGAFNDDGVYLSLGKAIASGQGYRSIHLVGAPVHVKFPPGLPLVYAVLWRLLGGLRAVAAAAAELSIFVTALASAVIWGIGRARLAIPAAPLAVLAVGPLLLDAAVQYYTLPITEPWYVLGWATALLVCLTMRDGAPDARLGTAALLGLAIGATALFRTQVLPLLPAVLIALLADRRPREAAVALATALLPLLAWSLVLGRLRAGEPVSTLPDEAGYLAWFPLHDPRALAGFLARTVVFNARIYAIGIGTYLSALPPLGIAIGVGFVALGAAGAVRLGRTGLALSLSVAGTLAMLLVWPSLQDRLMLPVLPFIGLLAAAAVAPAWRGGHRQLQRVAFGGVVAVAAIVGVQQVHGRQEAFRLLREGRAPDFRSPTWFLPVNSRTIAATSSWILGHTRLEDRVLVSMPSGVYLHTGREAVTSTPTESNEARSVFAVPGDFLVRRIADDGVTIVVLESPQARLARDVAEVARRCPDALVADEEPGFPVYYRVADRACVARLRAR